MPSNEQTPQYTRADFTSDQEVRWCPGCGDYSILAAMQRVFPELGIPKEDVVFISGIGCSGRFPYYMNTYGFHTIHGRAPTIATGLKLTRPELSVWLITGDGDGLSIGANHLMHLLRRNVDIKVLLFNNRIYGLTKGQYSPTSELGKVSKTSPQGSLARPIDPITFAHASGASFLARALDVDAKGLQAVIKAANQHKGSALIEIFQNCNIFNDGAFKHFSDKAVRADRTLSVEHGQPMIFGKARDKGIRLNGMKPEVVTFDPAQPPNDLLIFDAADETGMMMSILNQFHRYDLPVPMGILHQASHPSYDRLLNERKSEHAETSIRDMLYSGNTWVVE